MDKSLYTPLEEIPNIHARLNASFRSGKTFDIAVRKQQLAKLAFMLRDNLKVIQDASVKDLQRPPTETILGDINPALHEAVYAYNNLDKWTKDIKPEVTVTFQMMDVRVKPSPKGVVAIIAPFNYPVNLSLTPLVGAIAAGCTAVIKLPESLATVSPLLAELVGKYLDPEVVRVVQGAVEETSALLKLNWDHIFFTGSVRVGKIVAAAAAKFVTPVTLELGGKCPVVVDPRGADYKVIARRIIWGRTSNSGQVCICPDYVLIPREHQADLADALEVVYNEIYPSGPSSSPSLGRLVNVASAERIKGYLNRTQGKILVGGKSNGCFLAPTIVIDVKGDDATMQEEIFGPLLSIVPIEKLDDAVDFINHRPQPLALYVFTHDPKFKERITRFTRSGSINFNDTITQGTAAGLPFGGSGESGYGQYHGKWGFDIFTHYRASLETPTSGWMERLVGFRYPPYTDEKYRAAVGTTAPVAFPFDRDGRRRFVDSIRHAMTPLIIIQALIRYLRKGPGSSYSTLAFDTL